MSNSNSSGFQKEKSYGSAYAIWILLQQTKDAMLDAREANLKKLGISAAEASVLMVLDIIHSTPGIKPTPSEIGRWIVREPLTVSTLLIRMEKKGLIQRIHDSERKNQVLIFMTEQGYDKFALAMQDTVVDGIISKSLTDEQQATLRELLTILRNATFEHLDKEICFEP